MRNIHKSILAMVMAFIMLTGTTALAASTPPVAENLELTTHRNTSVSGKMMASAAKDAAVQFQITTEPRKGTLDFREDGSFVGVYAYEESRRWYKPVKMFL